MTQYFDIHVFYSRNDGYSIPFKIDDEKYIDLDEDEIIELAVELGILDRDDANQVSYVIEISEKDYIDMVG